MRRPLSVLRPLLWVLCACLLLLPQSAFAGDPSLAVDFDGDGRHDSVRLDQHRPSVLRVWLSSTGITQVLVSRRPLKRVAATDLDGDHRPELIASDSQSRLHVWTPRARGFRRFHPRRVIPQGLTPPPGRRVHGGNQVSEEALTGGALGPLALSRTSPRVEPDEASSACAPQRPPARPASPALPPFSPRPPPA